MGHPPRHGAPNFLFRRDVGYLSLCINSLDEEPEHQRYFAETSSDVVIRSAQGSKAWRDKREPASARQKKKGSEEARHETRKKNQDTN